MNEVVDTSNAGSPKQALVLLAAQLRDEDSVISPFVRESRISPVHGQLAALGPGAAANPGEYSLLVECVREGYLLHYDEPRVVVGVDPNLALLAGDYLYARGLERLAGLGDTEAIRELADLISLLAQIHVRDDPPPLAAESLWIAAMVAIAAGSSDTHEVAKAALREQREDAAEVLASAATDGAERIGIRAELTLAIETVGLNETHLFDLG